MKLTAYGIAFSSMVLATADVVVPTTGLAPSIVQGGAVAILGAVVWYLLTKTIPAQAAAEKDQRECFLKAMDAFLKAQEAERVETRELILALTGHDPRQSTYFSISCPRGLINSFLALTIASSSSNCIS